MRGKTVHAIAVSDGDEHDFYFYMLGSSSDEEILEKAFEIAYCKHNLLDEVRIDSVERG